MNSEVTSSEITIRQSDRRWRIRGLEKNMSERTNFDVIANNILYNPAVDMEMPCSERRLPKHVLTNVADAKIGKEGWDGNELGILAGFRRGFLTYISEWVFGFVFGFAFDAF